MNTHGLRSMFSRQNVVPVTLFFLLFIVVVFGFTAVTEQSAAKEEATSQQPKRMPDPTGQDVEKEFSDEDLKVKGEKPRGKWGFTTLPDTSQLKDPSLAVHVTGVQLLTGGGKYLGVTKIKRVRVENISSKILNSVQLRWTITSLDDRDKVLAEGTTPFANIWVEANISQVIEIQTLYPTQLLKHVAKNSEIHGEFALVIGLQEARFDDGTFWRRQGPIALWKSFYLDQSIGGKFPSLASLVPDLVPLLII